MGEKDDDTTRCATIAAAVIGFGDVFDAVADLHRLPADLPARGLLAAGLVEALVRDNQMADLRRLRDLDGLLAVAETGPPSAPRWTRVRATARALTLMRAGAELELADPAAALAELDVLAGDVGDDPALRPMIDSVRLALSLVRSIQEGDDGALSRFPAEMMRLHDAMPDNAESRLLKDLATEMMAVLAGQQRGEDVGAHIERWRELAAQLPPGHHLRAVVEEAAASFTMFGTMLADSPDGPISDERLAELEALTRRPGLSDPDRAFYHAQAGGAALGLGTVADSDRVATGIGHLRRAVELAGPDDPQRVFHLSGLALGLYRRGELTNARADLREARAVLDQARELAGGPHHPQWQMVNDMLSGVRRLLDGGDDFHHTALEGLRGYVWRVLLQPDLAGVAAVVRSAAQDASAVAVQSLVAGDPAGAISALDAGRGLALFAATEVRNVAGRLDEVGEAGLAQRWRTAAVSGDPAALPTDLRRDVLTALSAHGSATALLDPPGYGEIQQALAAVDADALVYLVPGEQAATGFAIAAPATGPPSYLALPNLMIDAGLDVERYLATLARRDRDAAAPPGDMPAATTDPELASSLDTLCDWAWRAAVGPLIERYLARLPEPASGRARRVVLVPMGDLARIPWQAARRRDGTYAIQLIGISQAASARMLCFSAGLPPVPLSAVGLVVGDPDTGRPHLDLAAARLEAYAVRQSFYRGARYVGRRPDGSDSPSGIGTAEEVRAWLTASGPAAGAMLHLACHGFVDAGKDSPTAYLLLAGGERLTAEELTALMARSPDRAVELVVLAACRTGLAINGYDEAYSLGTAFLAGGARCVLSTQWSIPDNATSVLMFMFHHYLRIEGRPAWDALRRAQLWMLDPARIVPGQMPAQLRAQLGSAELDAVVAWAAFVHWGR